MFPRNDSLPSGLAESLEQFGADGDLSTEALERFSDVQLLDWCRRLGLQGLSALNRSQLARRLLQTVQARRGESEPQVQKRLHETHAEATEPSPRGHPGDIPWSYGKNRVTAMVVDPRRLFVYWEVGEEALQAARARLGGAEGWLNLRVYDTTGRLFDGTNANTYFDQRLERGDRQWFFEIGRPTSTAVVDLGLKDEHGHFAVVCRSGRVDFPRREPVAYGPPEWMLVKTSTGDIAERRLDEARQEGGDGAHAGGGAVAEPPWGDWQPGGEPFPAWRPAAAGELRWIRHWREHAPGVAWEEFSGEGQETVHRSVSWLEGTTGESWEAGPFTYPVQVMAPTCENFEGTGHVWRVGEQTHVMHGPWQVVIRGIGSFAGRRVLSRWEVYRSWTQVARAEGEALAAGSATTGIGSSERFLGASLGQSELRLRGASEVFFLGASQLRFGGASEFAFRGASEWQARGASERLTQGASEWLMRGASERRAYGASEYRLGASERRLGASEGRLGGSEGRLGGSEARLASEGSGFSEITWSSMAVPTAEERAADEAPIWPVSGLASGGAASSGAASGGAASGGAASGGRASSRLSKGEK